MFRQLLGNDVPAEIHKRTVLPRIYATDNKSHEYLAYSYLETTLRVIVAYVDKDDRLLTVKAQVPFFVSKVSAFAYRFESLGESTTVKVFAVPLEDLKCDAEWTVQQLYDSVTKLCKFANGNRLSATGQY